MKIDLFDNEAWHLINQKISDSVGLRAPIQLQFFPSVGTALFEVAKSLSHFFSHKKHIGYVKGQSPYFHSYLPYFYKEMFQFTNIDPTIFDNPEEWVNKLSADTLFVIYAEDHAVTRQRYNWKHFDKLLNAKKIFSIRVSHNLHYFEKEVPLPFSIRICSLGIEEGCVSFYGQRVKTSPIFSYTLPFGHIDINRVSQQILYNKDSSSKHIIAFENSLCNIARPLFSNCEKQRLFDQASLFFQNINSESLAQIINANLNQHSNNSVYSLNLCALDSHNPHLLSQWWNSEPYLLEMSGLLFIPLELIKSIPTKLEKIICDAYFEICKSQIWSD